MADADETAQPRRSETKRIAQASGGIKRVIHRARAVPGQPQAVPLVTSREADTPQEQTSTPTSSETASFGPSQPSQPPLAASRQPPQTKGDRWIGKTIHNLRLLRCIGKGGFGAVYQAEHIQLKTFFAVKIVNLMRVGSEEFAERFLREARVIAQLDHPNIVGVSDFGFVEGADCAYMVMDYLHGESLEDRLLRLGQLPKEMMLSILEAVCGALTYIHQRGLIHRDLKPSNIFLASQPEEQGDVVKLLDFGIVAQEGESNLTTSGIWLGSPRYMSPEQAAGEAHRVDARADLYALGVVLFELLTSTQVFRGTSVSLIQHHAFTPPPRLRDRRPDHGWNPTLEALFARLLSKEPAARPADAVSLWSELKPALQAQALPGPRGDLPTGQRTAQPQISSPLSSDQDAVGPDQTFDMNATPGQETLASYPLSHGSGARWMGLLGALLLAGLGWWWLAAPDQPADTSHRITIRPLPETQRAGTSPRVPQRPAPDKNHPKTPSQRLVSAIRQTHVLKTKATPKRTAPRPVTRQKRRRRRRARRRRRRTKRARRTRPRPKPTTARQLSVSIVSSPSHAAVWHRGKKLGHTPLLFEGKPGQRLSLRFKKAGYITANRRVTLTRNTTVVRMRLRRDPFKGVKLRLP